MEIYLVRHTSVDIPAGYAYGQTDVPLRPSFEDEAEAVKKNLSGQCSGSFGRILARSIYPCQSFPK